SHVPLRTPTFSLDYLASRFLAAGGSIASNVFFEELEDVGDEFVLVINCAGMGARELVHDVELEPHRGQVAIVPKIDLGYARSEEHTSELQSHRDVVCRLL